MAVSIQSDSGTCSCGADARIKDIHAAYALALRVLTGRHPVVVPANFPVAGTAAPERAAT